MKVRLLFFASLRELGGDAEALREIDGPISVQGLWDALRRESPRLAAYPGPVRFAVNRSYVDCQEPLQDNDEVAFIPPVSGG